MCDLATRYDNSNNIWEMSSQVSIGQISDVGLLYKQTRGVTCKIVNIFSGAAS